MAERSSSALDADVTPVQPSRRAPISLTTSTSARSLSSRGQRLRGRGVEDRRRAGERGTRQRRGDGVERDLELRDGDVAALEGHALGVGGLEARVRAGYDDDRILGIRVDDDQRDAGRTARDDSDGRGVDVHLVEEADQIGGESVVADVAEHHGRRAARGGHRLVRALAARKEAQVGAEHGLAAVRMRARRSPRCPC